MRERGRGRRRLLVWAVGLALAGSVQGQESPKRQTDEPLVLHMPRARAYRSPEGSAKDTFVVTEKSVAWQPAQTAIIICDMWNQHWCQGATRRVGELAPAMNRTIAAARAKGVFIIHAPSSCMDAYKRSPRPKAGAERLPRPRTCPQHIGEWCNKIPAEEKGIYPIDQSDGGCDDGPQCPQGSPWKSQIAAIEIQDDDAISDSGAEIWNLLESRGITNVMLMGVHTNMCVLGRPFGLRNMARSGKNVVLVRDLTDTMYNSRMWPYVSHFEGTNRIVEHIEKYVAPTITSTDLTGQPAFQFKPDDRPRAVFLIGEDEYKTEATLPAFAAKELEPLGVRCTFVIADPKTPHDFPGVEALDDADLLVLSVRRRAPDGRADGDHSQVHRIGQAAGGHPHGLPRLRYARQGPGGARRMEDVRSRRAGRPLHRPPSQRCSSRDHAGAERQDPRDHSGRRDAVRQPGLALQGQPAGRRDAGSLDGNDPGPAARAGRVGQHARPCAGLLHVAGPSR